MIVYSSCSPRLALVVLATICPAIPVWTSWAAAQEPSHTPASVVEELVRRLDEQERELRYLRQRDADRQAWEASVVDRLPPTEGRFAGASNSPLDSGPLTTLENDPSQKGFAGCESCCPHCGGFGCKCPQTPAPCIDCPRVSTLSPYFNVRLFGSLNGELLFSEARPFLPSGVVLIFPDLGKETRTFEAHAKSTNIGAALTGPEILGLRAGGMFVTYLYGEQYEDDRYGFFIVRAYGDLKDEDQRIAIGLEGDLINPLAPTTLNYNAGNLAGNLGFFRGQFRYERYFHFSAASQLTTQFALSNPIATSFADFSIPPNYLLEDNGWPNLEGRVAWGLGEKSGPPGQAARPIEVGVSGQR